MTIIAMLSASYCHGGQIASQIAGRVGCPLRTDDDLLDLAADRSGVGRDKLLRAMHGPPSVFEKFTHEREIHIELLRAAMADLIGTDPLVYHGSGALLVPEAIRHALRACILARTETRVGIAVSEAKLSAAQAEKRLSVDDAAQARWSSYLVGLSPWTAELYDVRIPMDDVDVDAAVEVICTHAANPAVRATSRSRRALDEFQLATRVKIALGRKGVDVDVSAEEDVVTLTINRYVLRLEHLEHHLAGLASAVSGVRSVETRVGPHFHQPNIYGEMDIDVPKKILLVDDEVEFVQTLSERLETRNLESAIAFDGEQALAIAENDAPDVMVLDMKMPGLDGMEVLRKIKHRHPHTEVIVLTAHGSDREKEQALELGAFAYLRKPADIDDLARLMKEAYAKVQVGNGAGAEADSGHEPRGEDE